jgi:hypothetical protein
MKKLLSILGAVGLVATSSATVVACDNKDVKSIDVTIDATNIDSIEKFMQSVSAETGIDWANQKEQEWSQEKSIMDEFRTYVENKDQDGADKWYEQYEGRYHHTLDEYLENQDNPVGAVEIRSGTFYFVVAGVEEAEPHDSILKNYGSVTIVNHRSDQ